MIATPQPQADAQRPHLAMGPIVIGLAVALVLGACMGGSYQDVSLPPPSLGSGASDGMPGDVGAPASPGTPATPTAPSDGGPAVDTPLPVSPNMVAVPALSSYGYLSSVLDPMACLDRPVEALERPGRYVLQLYTCNYTGPQTFVYTPGGALKAVESERCVTAPQTPAIDQNASILTVQTCVTGNQNQLWDAVGDTWRNRGNGQCLDLVSGDLGYGARLMTSACSGAQSQRWRPLTNPNTKVPDLTAQAATLNERCSPTVVMSFPTGEANALIFQSNLPNFAADVVQAAHEVCAVAFTKAAEVPQKSATMLMRIRSGQDVPLAYSFGHEIGINFNYIASQIASKDLRDIQGMLRHEIAHYYQKNEIGAPGWLIEGMAEFIRFKTGHVNAVPQKGKPYTDGYAASGFFLIHLETLYPGFFNRLMVDLQQTGISWDMDYFRKKTGKSFNDLWNAYQATL